MATSTAIVPAAAASCPHAAHHGRHLMLVPGARAVHNLMCGVMSAVRARPALLVLPLVPLAVGALWLMRILRDPNPLAIWHQLARLPHFLRTWTFTKLVHLANPFSRTGRVRIVAFGEGHCTAAVREHWSLRNPFHSIHAAELALLGETAAGMAFFSVMPRSKRAIVQDINCKFMKKARGNVVAVSQCTPLFTGPHVEVVAEIRSKDAQGELLATITVVFIMSDKQARAITAA
ncbi:hypothetical protein AMAG_03177 [Allomyces macrogynus ATCC 38327]|uniref:Thioesterase domain-containing protein n=1 Tax=Allomyces macrogynus (strain ATCC 38327) TaxID=578462 RepID=A0A0L0S4Z1_ALLM3|nr:hypothetical protein AMAG_03177 [Allomyces macrogynus ATCC 38327]|eukprot:KNE57466.1 hypothetical protein AMAG_03177 [Allomyces macrogynus ATCC 38327]